MRRKRTLTEIVVEVVLVALVLALGIFVGYSARGRELQTLAHANHFRVFVPSNTEGYPYTRVGWGTEKGIAYLYDVDEGPYYDERGRFLVVTFFLDDGRSSFEEKRTFRSYILALEPQTIDLWGQTYRIQWIPVGGGQYRFIDGGDESYHQYQLTLSEIR